MKKLLYSFLITLSIMLFAIAIVAGINLIPEIMLLIVLIVFVLILWAIIYFAFFE